MYFRESFICLSRADEMSRAADRTETKLNANVKINNSIAEASDEKIQKFKNIGQIIKSENGKYNHILFKYITSASVNTSLDFITAYD